MITLSEDAARFHNRLRILLNIEREDLVAAGALEAADKEGWQNFQFNPFTFFIKRDDQTAAAIWSIVEAREAKRRG